MAAMVDDLLHVERDRRMEMRRSFNQQQSSMMGRNRALSMVAPPAATLADELPPRTRTRTRAGAIAESAKSRSASDPMDAVGITRGRSRTTVGGGPGQKCLVVEIREHSEKPKQRPDSQSLSANESSMFDVCSNSDMPPPPSKPAPAPPTAGQCGPSAAGVQQAETPVRCRSLSFSPSVYKPTNFSTQFEGLRGIIQASLTSDDPGMDESHGRARASTVMSGTSEAVLLDMKEKFKELNQRLAESEGRAENLAKQLRIERNLRQDLEAKVEELKAELAASKGK
eukprot:TRINITY_DN4270_c0_g3_i1.p1 TRINITY_DN4270_c0_g3~~TRINITY_DN4270_c0_g3_i1.p1  ORF type:complete len:310 (+),score=87.25 TRINITY_DN4270_c0_g3_i1:84-932(+)